MIFFNDKEEGARPECATRRTALVDKKLLVDRLLRAITSCRSMTLETPEYEALWNPSIGWLRVSIPWEAVERSRLPASTDMSSRAHQSR